MYTKKVISHFRNPNNYGKLRSPDGIGKVGNIVCGDVMWLYIKVGKNKRGQECISDISFETFGCVAAIATSSMVTKLAKGKTLTQALEITKDAITKSLGGLPPIKVHCSVLAGDALSEAIYEYLSKKGGLIDSMMHKRHERIARERSLVEEKYKDWVSVEEKAHGR